MDICNKEDLISSGYLGLWQKLPGRVHFNLSHFGYCPTGKEFEATELFY